jgi:hypothetical protein
MSDGPQIDVFPPTKMAVRKEEVRISKVGLGEPPPPECGALALFHLSGPERTPEVTETTGLAHRPHLLDP